MPIMMVSEKKNSLKIFLLALFFYFVIQKREKKIAPSYWCNNIYIKKKKKKKREREREGELKYIPLILCLMSWFCREISSIYASNRLVWRSEVLSSDTSCNLPTSLILLFTSRIAVEMQSIYIYTRRMDDDNNTY